jgi:hypothetical protein
VSPRAPVLSDEQWRTILEAVSPLPDNADLKKARRALEACLRDYRTYRSAHPRSKLSERRDTWRRINKLTIALHDALTEEWRHKRWSPKPGIRKRWHDDALRDLRGSAHAIVESLDRQMRARKGRSDPPREWFYWRLLQIWTDHFGGKLSASSTESGGPLVRFIKAAGALVDVTPSVPTVRAIIKAERRDRTGRDISAPPK